METWYIIPPGIVIGLLGIRCAFLLYRACKNRAVVPVALVLPRLFLLLVFIWIATSNLDCNARAVLVRWGLAAVILSEVLNDALYAVLNRKRPTP